MRSGQTRYRTAAWLYSSIAVILLCISIFESLKAGYGPADEVGDLLPLVRRQATNGTETTTTPAATTTTTPDPTTSAAAPTSATADPTTSAAPAPATTTAASEPAATTSSSGSTNSGSGSAGSSSDGNGNDGSQATTTVVSDSTTTAAAAAPLATGGSSSSSGSDSGSSNTGSSDSSGSSNNAGDSGTSNSGSSGSSGSTGGTTDSGSGSNSGTSNGDSGSSSGSGNSGDTSNSGDGSSGIATAAGAPVATTGAAATGAGNAPTASAAAPETASGIELWTSAGKPVTLKPLTVVSSAARTLITTGSDGKPTATTSSYQTTFVTTPVSTPSVVLTSSWTSTRVPSGSSSSQAGAAGEKAATAGGISTGGKVAVGILIPLLAIMAGIGIAVYLMRKHKAHDDDDEKNGKAAISGPLPVAGMADPRNRFSSLKMQNTDHPDHEPINQPTLPPFRTPAMSMYEGAENLTGAGAGVGAGAGAGMAMATPMTYQPSRDVDGMSGTTMGAVVPRARPTSTHSTISSVSAYSRESRYSHYSQHNGYRSRTPSPPPPLPAANMQQTNYLDPNPFSSADDSTAPHPYDSLAGSARHAPPRESRNFDAASAISALSFASDHPSQSASKAPSMSGVSYLDPNSTPENLRNRPFSEYEDQKHLSHLSHISDAPAADARATQLFYPFGDQVMTPGGRIVPQPIGPNPKNINPGLGGMRPDGSRSQNIGRKPSLNRPSAAGAPTLPQLAEVSEEPRPSFDFDFGEPAEPLTLMNEELRPSTSASAPVRTRAPTPEPPPIPRPSEESTRAGLRPRAPSVGYRRYRPDNL